MVWEVLNRSEKVGGQLRKMGGEWLEQRAVLAAVGGIEVRHSICYGMFQQDSGAVIEWMSAGGRRLDPRYIDGKGPKERARYT
jgi:hypothetical protein